MKDQVMICIHCGARMEIDQERVTPGVIPYKRCACGEMGMMREGDKYREIHKKKAKHDLYEKSRYRGGKLP